MIWYIHTPVEKSVIQALYRAERDGRCVPIQVLASGHFQSQQTIRKLMQEFSNDPEVEIRIVDNSGDKAVPVDAPLTFFDSEDKIYKNEKQVERRAKDALESNIGILKSSEARDVFRKGKR